MTPPAKDLRPNVSVTNAKKCFRTHPGTSLIFGSFLFTFEQRYGTVWWGFLLSLELDTEDTRGNDHYQNYYCAGGNFRQRKISSKATARQFVRNFFSSNIGRRPFALRSSLFCFSFIFTFINISDPTLVVCEKNLVRNLRFSLWLIRYFLKTFVYIPFTPCREVKFCPNIPLGDLSWNSLTEVMWRHHMNGFSNSKIQKKLTRKHSSRNGKWLVWQFCLTLWMK